MPNRAFLKSRTTYIYIYIIIIRPNDRRFYGAFLNIRLDNPGAMEVQAQGGQGLNQGGETDNGGSNYISLLIYVYVCIYICCCVLAIE